MTRNRLMHLCLFGIVYAAVMLAFGCIWRPESVLTIRVDGQMWKIPATSPSSRPSKPFEALDLFLGK